MTFPEREPASTRTQLREGHDERIEQIIGRLLQLGVLLAATVVLIGGIALLRQHGSDVAAFGTFTAESPTLRSLTGIFASALRRESRGIVQLGLLLLIATPVARVALTLGAFWIQRDRLYVVTTSIVLTLLLYGLIWGRA